MPIKRTLTGNTRHRRSWRGKLILQFEERVTGESPECNGGEIVCRDIDYTHWRDARLEDMNLEVKRI